MGISLTPEEQFEIFGTDKLEEYTEEARQRWGETDAWQQSQRRTAAYTKDDWIAVKAESDASIAGFTSALRAGEPAAGTVGMDLAEAHRQHISRWFYDCGYEMHRGLADIYTSDGRYIAAYDEIEPGLALYVRDAMHANADRGRGRAPGRDG